ncbi:uncharacterized protein [Parasteatoda tepidariorum]|uniref:uncharacterized protein isoform X2 n=1 Tax=Parasteatoda tepidariorum TaxID=114398 RepID=UPI0039BC5D5C
MITLRAGTYLAPSIPVEYFQMILHYLEDKLGIHSTLLYESRWEGPPLDREDPFLSGYLDLAWMTNTVYSKLLTNSSPVELLPVAPLHKHAHNGLNSALYVDVIMHKDLSEKVKDFIDLRGCKWAYSNNESLSGHTITLSNLKELGENASFFGNILCSGSHLNSIKMVTMKKVDAAAVDANCLAYFLDSNPHLAEEVVVLTTWGPLPPYPLVVNSKLDNSVKNDIVKSLTHMHNDAEGRRKLQEFQIQKFVPVSSKDFDKELLIKDNTKGLSFGTAYY